MPESIWYSGWYDDATGNMYLFADEATLTSEDPLIVLDHDLYKDAIVHSVGGTDGAYVSSISRTGSDVTPTAGDPDNPSRCSVT